MVYNHEEGRDDDREFREDWGQSFDDMDGGDWADYMGGPDDDEIEGNQSLDDDRWLDYEEAEYEREQEHIGRELERRNRSLDNDRWLDYGEAEYEPEQERIEEASREIEHDRFLEDWDQSFNNIEDGGFQDAAWDEEYVDQPLEYEGEYETQGALDQKRKEFLSRMEEIVIWLSESSLIEKFSDKDGFFILRGHHIRLRDGSVVDLFNWLSEEGIKGGIAVAGYSIMHARSDNGIGLSFVKIIDAPFMPFMPLRK